MSGVWSSVPLADMCVDSRNHGWVLVRPSLVPFESLWHCPVLGVSASWACLNQRIGVLSSWNAGRYRQEVAK